MYRLATLIVLIAVSSVHSAEILEFTGAYCGGCRQMEPVVADLVRRGMPIRQIDVQRHPELARQFGVQSIPCFVSIVNDRPVDRIVGPVGPDRLVAMYERAVATSPPPTPTLPAGPGGPELARGQSEIGNPGYGQPNSTRNVVETAVTPATVPASSHVPAHASTPPNEYSPPETDPVARAMSATVRLKIVDPRGQSYGTGTIIDVHDDEALVVSCGHIFRDSSGKGQIYCDLFCGSQPREIPGKLVSYDLRRDIGLVSFRPGVAVTPVPVGGGGSVSRENDPVFSIGCSRGQDPTVNHNRVIAVNRYHGPANLVVGGRPVDGRSGGGLFNRQGMLIGVCNAADQEADEGLYAALGPVQAELDEAGLGFVYRRDQLAELDTRSGGPTRMGQPAAPVAMSTADPIPGGGGRPMSPTAVSHESTNSQEVIVILRDKRSPGEQGQAFVLDHPSGQLLHVLSTELARRGPHVATGMSTESPVLRR